MKVIDFIKFRLNVIGTARDAVHQVEMITKEIEDGVSTVRY